MYEIILAGGAICFKAVTINLLLSTCPMMTRSWLCAQNLSLVIVIAQLRADRTLFLD